MQELCDKKEENGYVLFADPSNAETALEKEDYFSRDASLVLLFLCNSIPESPGCRPAGIAVPTDSHYREQRGCVAVRDRSPARAADGWPCRLKTEVRHCRIHTLLCLRT